MLGIHIYINMLLDSEKTILMKFQFPCQGQVI